MNRAVFLDFDGVLGPFGRDNPRVLDASCIARVHRLAREARIVLASSWPRERAEEALDMPLEELDEEERRTYDGRPRAILAWLRAHPEVTAWVSIDDDPIVADLERAVAEDLRFVERFGPHSRPLPRELLAHRERFLRTDWVWSGIARHSRGAGLTDAVLARALRILRGEPEVTLDVEIARVRAAMVRRQRRLDAMYREAAGACCPSCFHGARHTALADRQERAAAWLCVLLGKRGAPGDAVMVGVVRSGAWL